MKYLLTGAMLLLSTSAFAVCIRPTDGGFYNPNCVTQEQYDQMAVIPRVDPVPWTTSRDHGNSYNDREASAVTTRAYAFGSEPRVGKKGTQSVPAGLRELSRRVRSQALASRSTLTGPAVHVDPVTGAKTLRSVVITYGIPAGPDARGNDSRTSYNDNQGGSGRSHQGM